MRRPPLTGVLAVLRSGVLTCVWLVRRPAYARDFSRMLRTLGKATLDLRQAWLPFALTDELGAAATKKSAVFEFGGGGSTAWFADRFGRVTTVEHHREWFSMLESRLGGTSNVTLLYRSSADDYEMYVGSIDAFPDDSFDLVVVDGRERVRCFARAVAKVKPGGSLLLDDADRKRYRDAFDLVDWPRRVVRGFAPSKPTLAHTAVFTRPIE